MTDNRRYSDAEVAAIFERATTAQEDVRQVPATGEGMTLAQLQEIGREVGIQPSLIAEAANMLGTGEPAATRSMLGMPIGVERIISIDRRLTDEEWERVVVTLREVFDARGVTRGEGSLRQWTNGNLQALLEPTATGQRIRLRTFKGSAPGALIGGLAVSAAAGTGLTTFALNGVHDTGLLVALSAMGIAGVSVMIGTLARLPGWARRRREQMEVVAARIAEMSGPSRP
ncbi:MAG: hypothetical protein ABIY52_17105 [Gemmatimonadaceae bacterium]